MITMQISIYPLGEKEIAEKLNIFWDFLRDKKVCFKVTALSTLAWDEDEDKLYDIVLQAYRKIRKACNAVMVTTMATGNEKEIKQLLNYL